MASTTRERILDAALELIQRNGFGGTAVTEIEEMAGLSPGSGSFYRHFRSKEEVFRTVLERELDRAQQHRQTFERGPVAAPEEALTRRLLQQLEYLDHVRPLINLLALEHGRFPDLTRRIRATLVDQGIAEESEHLTADLPTWPGHQDPHALLAIVVSALVGYHLTTEFFGHPPANIPPPRFAKALSTLLTTPQPPDPPSE